jgi:hypothetical protein
MPVNKAMTCIKLIFALGAKLRNKVISGDRAQTQHTHAFVAAVAENSRGIIYHRVVHGEIACDEFSTRARP